MPNLDLALGRDTARVTEVNLRLEGGRRLEIDGLVNARDLGGHHTADGPTRYRRVIRSEAPTYISPEGRLQLAEYGVVAYLDLRSDEEARAEPSPLGSGRGYRRVPILNEAALRRVRSLTKGEELMEFMLVERAPQIGRSLHTLLELASDGAVLVHCRAGKDRTGLVAALLLSNAGVCDEAVAADHARSEHNLEPLFERWVATAKSDEERALISTRKFAATQDSMLVTLRQFWRRHSSGVSGYLRHAGLTADEIQSLRGLLLDMLDPARAA